jgi:hypothetical protein
VLRQLAWLAPLVLVGAADAHALERLAPAPAGVDAIAYAGAERIYATGRVVRRIGADGAPQRIARLRGRAEQIAASPTRIALVERRGRTRRLHAGPPSGPLAVLARCRGRFPEIPTALVAVAGDAVVEALSCERARGSYNGATRLRVHDAAGVRELAAPPGERFIALAGAPGALAWAVQADARRGPVRVEVADPASGAVRYAVPGLPEPFPIAPVAVAADGTAAFCGADDRLAWASPAAPVAHPVAAGCGLDLAIAGGRIVVRDERDEMLRVVGLDGAARILVRDAGGLPFAWSGERILFGGLGCGEDFLAEIGSGAAPYRGERCHVRVARVTRGRSPRIVRVTVACRPGCQGDVEVQLGHQGRTHGAPLRLRRAGRRTVRVRLRGRSVRLLHDYRTVPFNVGVIHVNPADGALARPIVTRSGRLPGDGARAFPPPRRDACDDPPGGCRSGSRVPARTLRARRA